MGATDLIILEDVVDVRNVIVNPLVDQRSNAACLLPAQTESEHEARFGEAVQELPVVKLNFRAVECLID